MDTISNAVFITLAVELVFSLALPIGVIIFWKKKTDCSLAPLGMGAAAFFVFSMVLGQLVRFLVFGLNTPLGDAIVANPWLYALYGGSVAGILEETARFLVFRTMMQKYTGRENAVTYGIGHGGIECFLVLGMTMVSNILLAVMFNSTGAEAFIAQYAPEQADAIMASIQSINTIDPAMAIAACFERLCALILQIELSVVVFAAVQLKRFWLYPLAILLHMGIDFIAALYQAGTLPYLFLVEVLLLVYVIVIFFFVRRLYAELPGKSVSLKVQRVEGRRL